MVDTGAYNTYWNMWILPVKCILSLLPKEKKKCGHLVLKRDNETHCHEDVKTSFFIICDCTVCRWTPWLLSKPGGYGKISQCITTTKHSKAKTVCIFLGIYCIRHLVTQILTDWGRDKDNTSLYLILRVGLTILSSVPSHYPNRWWLFYWHIYAPLSLNQLIQEWNIDRSWDTIPLNYILCIIPSSALYVWFNA